MHVRASPRPSWSELPDHLRTAVEALLGARVAEAESAPGGWSPGSADRVLLEDGRRAFVKAASAEVNAVAVRLHRREAEVLRLLRGTGAAPDLVGAVEEGPWFALAVADIEGRHPEAAADADTTAVLDAVAALPDADGSLARIEDELAHDLGAWTRLDEDGLDTLPQRVLPALPALDALARSAPQRIAGGSVVHLDLRMDNVLIDGSGTARIVDWPSAVRGARWVDAVTYLLDLRGAGVDVRDHLNHPVLAAVPPESVDALLAVLGGYFMDSARRPPSPGVEAVRPFQRAQGLVVLNWLRERRPDLGLD